MADLDLKFTPDWLKEDSPKPSYKHFEGEPERSPRREHGRFSERREGPPRPKRGKRDRLPEGRREQVPREEVRPAPVTVEFLPEPLFIEPIAKQIRSSARAYPLIDVARMFLEQPERYRVKITAADPAFIIYRCADEGPISSDRAVLERQAFDVLKDKYYAVEVTQGEPPKGNYTNVARCRLNGELITPTNHHSYQKALRGMYSERFSRRMSFEDFQREIEVVREPEAVEAWKEQARAVTTFRTVSEPVETFASEEAARQHFANQYLPQAIQSGSCFEISGTASRLPGDPRLFTAIRSAFHDEEKFPGQIAHHLRTAFAGQHLHVFKWGGKRQHVSTVRPNPFRAGRGELAANAAAILKTIEESKRCTRKELVAQLVTEGEDAATQRAKLFADLHWLVGLGHVVEFHDGLLAVPSRVASPPIKDARTGGGDPGSTPESSAPSLPDQP